MHALQNRLGKTEFLIAALVVMAVAGCGRSQSPGAAYGRHYCSSP